MSEVMQLLFPLIKFVLYVFVAAWAVFIFEGFSEFYKYPVTHSRSLRFDEFSWEGYKTSFAKCLISCSLFFLGILGFWLLSFRGINLSSHPNYFFLWYFALCLSLALVWVGFSRIMFIGAFAGYWTAWWIHGKIPQTATAAPGNLQMLQYTRPGSVRYCTDQNMPVRKYRVLSKVTETEEDSHQA